MILNDDGHVIVGERAAQGVGNDWGHITSFTSTHPAWWPIIPGEQEASQLVDKQVQMQ